MNLRSSLPDGDSGNNDAIKVEATRNTAEHPVAAV